MKKCTDQVLTVVHQDMYGQDEALGQVNIGLQKGTCITEQWYRLQDREGSDREVLGADGKHALIQLSMAYSLATRTPECQDQDAQAHDSCSEVGQGRIPSPVPVVAKASASKVTRHAAPPMRWTPPPPPPPAFAPQSSKDCGFPVKIEVTLDMDYASAAAIENSFQIEVANDLARALQGFPDCVHIINFRQGSVIVDVELSAGLCPQGRNALEVLQNLQSQVNDARSMLKQGKFTRHVVRIRKALQAEAEASPRLQGASDMEDSFFDIPLQIDTDAANNMHEVPEAEPSPVQLQKLSRGQLARAMTTTPTQILTRHPLHSEEQEFLEAREQPWFGSAQPQEPDHYHPEYLLQSAAAETPRVSSFTAPTSPPLLLNPQHDPRQAYPNPFMYPIQRGLSPQPPPAPAPPAPAATPPRPHHSPAPSPQKISQLLSPTQHVEAQMQHQQAALGAGRLPMASTWLGRYRQRRNQHKDLKRMQREEAMQRLREQDAARAHSINGRTGMVAHLRTMLTPARARASHPAWVHPAVPAAAGHHQPAQVGAQHGPHHLVALHPVPRLKDRQEHQQRAQDEPPQHPRHPQRQQPWIMHPEPEQQRQQQQQQQQVQQHNHHHHHQQTHLPRHEAGVRYGAPPEFGSPDKSRYTQGGHLNELPADDTSQQSERQRGRVASWLGSIGPAPAMQLQPERPPEAPKNRFHTMLKPMEPTILDVYAGTGTVRFHPALNSYYGGGNAYESYSGYNTPTRGYGALSPVALSAMTAPTPRVNSSMWSSMEMALGDFPDKLRQDPPAFPHGYDPSKPFLRSGLTAANMLRPQEVHGSAVAIPQESINAYVQNRGGDIEIQPSRQPVRLPPPAAQAGASQCWRKGCILYACQLHVSKA